MGCAIGKVNVKMIDAAMREKVGEVKGIACTLLSFHLPSVFLLMPTDKLAWPSAHRFRSFLPDSQNFLGRRIVNGGTQPRDMLMSQTGERRINRTNLEVDPKPFQRQHLSVAKRLRDHRISGEKVTESHLAR